MTGTARDRHVEVPGIYNLRDIGGHRTADGGMTRCGVVFRGDSLHRLGPEGEQVLARLGLRTLVDLRSPDEQAAFPSRVAAIGTEVISWPLAAGDPTTLGGRGELGARYLALAASSGERIAGVARLLATPGRLPALVHCMAGKDRTGLVIGLLLSALGVPDDDVVAEYAESFSRLGADYRADATARARARGLDDEEIEIMLTNDRAHLSGVLDAIRPRHAGAAGYLLDHGLSAGELERLKDALVERPAGSTGDR